MSSGKSHDHAREGATRLLDQARHLLVRAAADMQGKGTDTAQLSKPVVLIGEAIALLNGGEPAALAPTEEIVLTPFNADRRAGEGSLRSDQATGV